MRYKLLAFASILLLANSPPIFGQEMSPIVIKTGKPVPSVVRSGEPFKVVYRAEYLDSILIIEEKIQPDNISVDQFEAIKLEVITLPLQNDEKLGIIHVQEFIYTFRIIKPEKGAKIIPSFDFVWVEKKAGTTATDAKEINELKKIPTDEVEIGYVTSIPEKPPDRKIPTLDIRDDIVFSLPQWKGSELRRNAYLVIGFSSLLFILTLALFFYQPKAKEKDKKTDESTVPQTEDVTVPLVSAKTTRKRFLLEIKALGNSVQKMSEKPNDGKLKELGKDLYSLISSLLLAELSLGPVKASASQTPKELQARLANLNAEQKKKMGAKFGVMLSLADRSRNYYDEIQSGRLTYFQSQSVVLAAINSIVDDVESLSFWHRARKNLTGRRGTRNAR